MVLGVMEPFSKVIAGLTLVGQGHVDSFVLRTFGLWSEADSHHSAALRGQVGFVYILVHKYFFLVLSWCSTFP